MSRAPNRPKTPLAAALLKHMTAKSMSQGALSRAASVSQSIISELLSGKRSAATTDTAKRLATALGCPAGELLGDPAPAAAAVGTEANGVRLQLRLDQLIGSPLNPRKTFDATEEQKAELQALAESIADVGLLENLVVRALEGAGPGKGHTKIVATGLPVYEVIAGGRRLRALRLLADDGRWPDTAANVECKLLAADDVKAQAVALIENLAREDLHPLEEGRAFAALRDLDPAAWSTAAIAERIHKTQRYVQQRLALATKLIPEAQQALADSHITIDQARALSAAPGHKQKEVIKSATAGQWTPDADSLARQVRGQMVPASAAAFDLEEYERRGGTFHVVEKGDLFDDGFTTRATGSKLCADGKLFNTMQKEVARARAKKLRETWAWAEVVDARYSSHPQNAYEKSADKAKAGAIVWIDHGHKIHTATGLLPKAKSNDRGAQQRNGNDAALRTARAAREAAAERFTIEIAAPLVADRLTALRMLLLGFLEGPVCLTVEGSMPYGRKRQHTATLRAAMLRYCGHTEKADPHPDQIDVERAWGWALKLESEDLLAGLAACAAEALEVADAWHDSDPLHPLARRLANAYGIPVPPELGGPADGAPVPVRKGKGKGDAAAATKPADDGEVLDIPGFLQRDKAEASA